MSKSINVLSIFDGMSCTQLALQRLGVQVDNYFASEVDKYAIKVTQANFPSTVQLGDISKIDSSKLPKIDLMVGGSPCQDLSFAGKGKGLIKGERSSLFFAFVDLLKAVKPKYFLVENVRMKKEYQDIISNILGVEPIMINSGRVSAQNRVRLYWTNLPNVKQPEDKGLVLSDILESGDANYFKGGNLKTYFEKHRRQLVFSRDGLCHVGDADLKGIESIKRVYHKAGKAPTLTTMGGGHREPKVFCEGFKWRKLTPLECERLQTVPDGYTAHVSNSQRYKMLGNGFTVDVIAHILQEGMSDE